MLCIERGTWSWESTIKVKKVLVPLSRRTKQSYFSSFYSVWQQSHISSSSSRDSAAARLVKVSLSFSAVTFLQLTDKICGISLSHYRSAWYRCHLCKLLQGHEPIDPKRWGRIAATRLARSNFLSVCFSYTSDQQTTAVFNKRRWCFRLTLKCLWLFKTCTELMKRWCFNKTENQCFSLKSKLRQNKIELKWFWEETLKVLDIVRIVGTTKLQMPVTNVIQTITQRVGKKITDYGYGG